MQKAFRDIIERLEELAEGNRGWEDEDYYRGESCGYADAIEIVNQVAEEYSHRNDDLVIDASHRIESLDDVIARLQYKADNIKAKLEPSYFTECIDYLKSLPKCNDGWIPCEERLPLPHDNVLVSTENGGRTVAYTDSNFANMFWDMNDNAVEEVIAWQPLPQPYVKGE